MASKGMSMTLTIIVAAVVILVTALVLLTIFGNSLIPIVGISQARAQCTAAAESSCGLTNQLPPTWNSPMYKVEGSEGLVACSNALVCSNINGCKDNKVDGSCL